MSAAIEMSPTPASRSTSEAVQPSERIRVVDMLRGFALLGMLLVHVYEHSGDARGPWERAVEVLIQTFVLERSFATFAFLFGVGFAIQLRRAEQRGTPFVRVYLRRLAVLFLFGFTAHALFGFNVLIGYSVYAVVLLFVRHWSSRALIIFGLLSLFSWALYNLALGAYEWWSLGSAGANQAFLDRAKPRAAINQMLDAAVAQSSYLTLIGARLRHMAWFYRQPWMFLPGTVALFVLGLLALRYGVFDAPGRHKRLIVRAMVVGFVCWIVSILVLPWIPEFAPTGVMAPLRFYWRLSWGLMVVYVCAVLLLIAWRPALQRYLTPLAWAGQMALTNYFVQIASVDLATSGYGLGLGELSPAMIVPGTIGFFALQVVFSRWWLTRYRFGPLEWLWRSATYGEPAPLRRTSPVVARA
jgi:uncharacterized protein